MGDMGSAVASMLRQGGHRVVTSLAGRSALSRRLAVEAGAEDLESLPAVLQSADLFLSILPPAAALDLAAECAELLRTSGRPIVYADCNAVAPATVARIARVFDGTRVTFVDAGIVGPAPRADAAAVTRLYVAGEGRQSLVDLDVPSIDVVDLGADIGRASSLKMCYGALNKGTDALWTAILMAADRLGVRAELMNDFDASQPAFAKRMRARLPFHAATAARFTGEMREIAETFDAVGVTGDFHRGAEWLFGALAESRLAGESRATLPKQRSLDEAIAAFVAVLAERDRAGRE